MHSQTIFCSRDVVFHEHSCSYRKFNPHINQQSSPSTSILQDDFEDACILVQPPNVHTTNFNPFVDPPLSIANASSLPSSSISIPTTRKSTRAKHLPLG